VNRRVVWASALLLPFALAVVGSGCSSSSKSSSRGPTTVPTTAPAATSSTSPAPTIEPPGVPSTVATANCGGETALLNEIRASLSNGQLHLRISQFVTAPSDHTWVRATIPPPSPPDTSGELSQGAVVVAHCQSGAWQAVDIGAGFVGCNPPVPAQISQEIGYQCQ
jgi:hypothetical protein